MVIAQAKFPYDLQRGEIFRVPVSLSRPELFDHSWSVDGIAVDKEVLSRDSDMKPKVVLVHGVVASTKNTITIEAPESMQNAHYDARPVPSMHLRMQVGPEVYEAWFEDFVLVSSKENKFFTRDLYFAQLKNVSNGDNLLGVHAYVYRTKRSWEVRFRIHNGVITQNAGAIFFDSLTLELDGETHDLVGSLPRGQKHLIRPQEQFMVSYSEGHQPRQGRVLRSNGFFSVGGFGAEQERIPGIESEYNYHGIPGEAGAEEKVFQAWQAMKTAIETGVANESVDLHSNKMGPFMPIYIGDSGAGAPGGWGISTIATRTQSETEIALLKLQQECTNARTPRALYGDDGLPKTAYDFVGDDGKIPFYFNTIGGWRSDSGYLQQNDTLPHFQAQAGKPHNNGNCPYLGTKYTGGMASYEGYDDAHYSRGVRYAKSLYYLTGDWSAKADLLAMAEWAHFSWIEFDTSNDYWHEHGHSVFNQLRWHVGSEHKWGSLERAFGWTCDSMAQAFAIAGRGWRQRFKPWFDAATQLIEVSMMPSGLTQREPPGSHLHQTAVSAGFPAVGYDVAGAIYIGICCQGFQAINKAVYGNENLAIKNYLSKVIDWCFTQPMYGAGGPAYYMSPAPAGGGLPFANVSESVFAGGLESYNFWWSCIHAYRATGDRKYFEYLKNYAFSKPTHVEKVQQLFINANGWDDKLSESAYYIAEVQRKIQTEGTI